MAPDDEILFGRVADESRTSYEQVEHLRRLAQDVITADLAVARAEFELHGATLRLLRNWYPHEERVQAALADWELRSFGLRSMGLAVEV
ncbi:MAG TPA: hypothetical protein VKB39_04260 [Candidatus Baltobacteraceae bacterium]|nr:hypothetical protein [Candidatus Baltobacteraceae bacterium]